MGGNQPMKKLITAVIAMMVTLTSHAGDARALAIYGATYAPLPQYPYEAVARHITGTGVCLMKIDPKRGSVTSAKMIKSTGSSMLDIAIVSAFRQWKFKPGSVLKVEIPITFTTTGVSLQVTERKTKQ
jgi:TonB family protein